MPQSHHLRPVTHINILLDCSPYWTVTVRYPLLTVSPFKSLSVHNPSYLPPTVLEHTLTV